MVIINSCCALLDKRSPRIFVLRPDEDCLNMKKCFCTRNWISAAAVSHNHAPLAPRALNFALEPVKLYVFNWKGVSKWKRTGTTWPAGFERAQRETNSGELSWKTTTGGGGNATLAPVAAEEEASSKQKDMQLVGRRHAPCVSVLNVYVFPAKLIIRQFYFHWKRCTNTEDTLVFTTNSAFVLPVRLSWCHLQQAGIPWFFLLCFIFFVFI